MKTKFLQIGLLGACLVGSSGAMGVKGIEPYTGTYAFPTVPGLAPLNQTGGKDIMPVNRIRALVAETTL